MHFFHSSFPVRTHEGVFQTKCKVNFGSEKNKLHTKVNEDWTWRFALDGANGGEDVRFERKKKKGFSFRKTRARYNSG